MTTGVKIDDRRSLTPSPDGAWTLGYCRYRTWNGTDAAKRKPVLIQKRRLKPKRVVYYTLNEYKGKKRTHFLRKRVSVEYEPVFKWVRARLPKRARTAALGEHPYTMEESVTNSFVTAFRAKDTPTTYRTTYMANQPAGGGGTYPTIPSTGTTHYNNGMRVRMQPYVWTSNDQLALIGKLREKIVGSSFHLGTFLGEGKEALNMIGNSAARIALSLTHLKRMRLGDAAQALFRGTSRSGEARKWAKAGRRGYASQKDTASIWLEMQYGWLPLLQDAEGAAQFLAESISQEIPPKIRFKAALRRRQPFTVPSQSNYFDIDTGRMDHLQVKQLTVDISEKNAVRLSGLVDPLTVAWELVPYSFVADWFLPIGDYLTARGFIQELKTSVVISTEFWKAEGPYLLVLKPTYTGPWGYGGVTCLESEKLLNAVSAAKMTRTVSSSISLPVPEVVHPKDAFPGWKRAANATALLTNFFLGKVEVNDRERDRREAEAKQIEKLRRLVRETEWRSRNRR